MSAVIWACSHIHVSCHSVIIISCPVRLGICLFAIQCIMLRMPIAHYETFLMARIVLHAFLSLCARRAAQVPISGQDFLGVCVHPCVVYAFGRECVDVCIVLMAISRGALLRREMPTVSPKGIKWRRC